MAVKTVLDVLAAAGAVTALVPASRMSPLIKIQEIILPAITAQRQVMLPKLQLSGSADLDENLVDVRSWAATYIQTRAIADAARAALEAAHHYMTFENDEYTEDVTPEQYSILQTYRVWT